MERKKERKNIENNQLEMGKKEERKEDRKGKKGKKTNSSSFAVAEQSCMEYYYCIALYCIVSLERESWCIVQGESSVKLNHSFGVLNNTRGQTRPILSEKTTPGRNGAWRSQHLLSNCERRRKL